MVGSYSEVHWERTRRRVMLDFPAPPSPQMVMVIFWGVSIVVLVYGRRVTPGVLLVLCCLVRGCGFTRRCKLRMTGSID